MPTLAVVLCAITGGVHPERAQISPERRAIFAAAGPIRPLDARLAGASYAPYKTLPPDVADRVVISAQIRKAGEKGLSEAVADLGVALLLKGKLDDSIAALERAVALDRRNTRAESDLAAAYLARAPQIGFDDAVKALAHATRAVHLDPSLPEARFNHALALEGLSLSHDAEASWRAYLQIDSTSPWAEEARSHGTMLARAAAALRRGPDFLQLAAMRDRGSLERAIAQDPQSAREFLEDEALPQWARLAEAKDARAVPLLVSVRELAELLSRKEGDRLPAEAVEAIERASRASGSSGRLQALAAGHRQYSEGQSALQAGDVKKAADLFTASQADFRRGRSPFVHWAEFQLGVCAYQEADYLSSQVMLAPIAESARSFPSLRGRALWILGLGRGVQRDLESALSHFRQALDLFRHTGEAGNIGAMENLIGETLEQLGRKGEAATHLYAAVRSLVGIRDGRRRGAILAETGSVASNSGFPEVGLLFHEEAIRGLAAGVDRPALVFALLNRADNEVALKRVREALQDLRSARSILDQLANDGIREALLGDQLSRLGSIFRRIAPINAIDAFRQSIEVYRRARYSLLLPVLLKERALAYEEVGQKELAERDLLEGISVVESRLAQVPEGSLRSAFYDKIADLYDAMILLELELGKVEEGFDYSDRARTAGLRAMSTLESARVDRNLPLGTVVVGYSPIREHLLIWVVQNGNTSVVTSPLSPARAAVLVSKLRSAIIGERSETEFAKNSAELYSGLLYPIEAKITPFSVIEILPSKILAGLPFAALINPATGRYLVEDHVIGIAPSAGLYLRSIEQERLKLSSTVTSFVIGDPAFDVANSPGLSRLPKAADEAKLVASLYRRHMLLLAEAATKDAFIATAGEYEIVHFAGHNVKSNVEPLRSGLVFAGNSLEEEVLTGAALYSAYFGRTRVVVLSACATVVDNAGIDGATDLAGPFMAAGVPSIVGSLWDVADEETLGLVMELHRGLSGGEGVLGAFHRAQLSVLRRWGRGAAAARRWAAFEVIGGGSEL